jgi:membrane fusion protein (multidrug efflux system)
MRRGVLTVASLLILLAGAAGCSGKGDGIPGKDARAGKPAVAVDAAKAALGDVVEGIEVVGTLSPKYQAELKSEYGGLVTHVYVTEWVRVRKGDPLMKVDTREGEVMLKKAGAALEAAKASLLEAEAASSRAAREYERALKLQESGLVTRQGLDDARTQAEAADARAGAARAQVAVAGDDVAHAGTRLAKAVIRAPFDGTVERRLVNVGDLVGEMQKVVFRLVDNRVLQITLNVPSAEMAALRVGQPLVFTTDAFPGRRFSGTVMYVNPSVRPEDRSVQVLAEILNSPELLKGGLYVKGRIVTGTRKGVVLVPRAALQSLEVAAGKGVVFVVEDNVARRREVSTGAVLAETVEIPRGLRAGETVVTRGAFNVKDGDALKVAGVTGK